MVKLVPLNTKLTSQLCVLTKSLDVIFNDGTGTPLTTRANTLLTADKYTITGSTAAGGRKRTRFRFINMSAFSQFFIAIEDHPVSIIEVDGVLLDNSPGALAATRTEGIVLAPGQRVSVLLEHKTNSEARSKPYRIVVALDPRLAPSKTDTTGCAMPNFSSGVTMSTFSCLWYNGVSTGNCDFPTTTEFSMLKFRAAGVSGSVIPKNEPGKEKTLDVPWKDYLHTPYAYPWNFNERLFIPRDKSVDRTKLMNVKPGNVKWLKITDATGESGTL